MTGHHHVGDSLDFAAELIQIIAFSPKRHVLFEQLQQEVGNLQSSLRPLRPAR